MGEYSKYIRAYNPTIGMDPEIVLLSNTTKKLCSAREALGTTTYRKTSPHSFGSSEVCVDGFLAEINPAPNTCREWVLNNIRDCLTMLYNTVERKGLDISCKSTVNVPKPVRTKATEAELELGCEPDYSAYSGQVNIIPDEMRNGNTRSGGGHLHYGFNYTCGQTNVSYQSSQDMWETALTYEPVAHRIIKAMDYMVGLPCVLLDDKNAATRRKLYGKAGSYRIQPHGIEYRVLSNFWVNHPALASMAMELGRSALRVATCQYNVCEELFNLIPAEDVQSIINENCKTEARRLLPKLVKFHAHHCGMTYNPIFFVGFIDRCGKNVLFPDALNENWRLETTKFKSKNTWKSHGMGWTAFLGRDISPERYKLYDKTRERLRK